MALQQLTCSYTHVTDMLVMLADIAQPRSFDELTRYGLDDPS